VRAGITTGEGVSAICDRRSIQIAQGFGRPVPTVEAQCFGEWATHRHVDDPSLWVITLLPLGLNLPPDWCSFPSEQHAAGAMVDIARLRNSWGLVTQADFTLALKQQLMAIAQKHGAVEGPVGIAVKADHNRQGRRIDSRPNGYGAALG
jgi:hypothetical protein